MFTVKISRAALFAAFGLLSGSVSAQTAGQAAGCGGRDLQADTWVATDALGRTLPGYAECGPRKTNRTVAMFYFVTHNQNGAKDGPYNVTEILKADPVNPKWGGGVHYWGEPEAGYYSMTDEWIIRRHARMLSDAGVDLIVLDNTNDNIYKDVFVFIAEVFRKMRSEGETTPQIACLASQNSVQQLWDQIYSRGLYADLWFRWKGKPLLMFGQHIIGGRQQMDDVRFPKEIRDFFTIRQSWAWTTLRWYDDGHDEWPWWTIIRSRSAGTSRPTGPSTCRWHPRSIRCRISDGVSATAWSRNTTGTMRRPIPIRGFISISSGSVRWRSIRNLYS